VETSEVQQPGKFNEKKPAPARNTPLLVPFERRITKGKWIKLYLTGPASYGLILELTPEVEAV